MRPADSDTAVRREHQHDQVSRSFLVRVWYEASESGEGEAPFRGYLRNLQTGEERFLRDPRKIGEEIGQQIQKTFPSGGAVRTEGRRAR